MKKVSLFLVLMGVLALARATGVGAEGKQSGVTAEPVVRKMIEGDPEMTEKTLDRQVENQVQTQNQGEEDQLMVKTEEKLEASGSAKEPAPRADVAREKMSVVAQKVEELLASDGSGQKGGIGEQVREIAKQQQQAQTTIEGDMDKLESRSGLMKALFGSDKEAVGSLRGQIEQNQLRIQELIALQDQTMNQSEKIALQETVQVLLEQNVSLQDQVTVAEKSKGIFGWMFGWMGR